MASICDRPGASRPANLIALSKSIDVGEAKGNDPVYAQVLTASVADVVKKQRELGVDIPDDGEFGKPVARPLRHTKPSIKSQALPIWR